MRILDVMKNKEDIYQNRNTITSVMNTTPRERYCVYPFLPEYRNKYILKMFILRYRNEQNPAL